MQQFVLRCDERGDPLPDALPVAYSQLSQVKGLEQVSFPRDVPPEELDQLVASVGFRAFVPANPATRPATKEHETAELAPEFVFDDTLKAFTQRYRVVPWPAERIEQDRARRLAELRADRDRRLRESDWTQLADAPLTAREKAEATTYRQQLRAYPETITDVMKPPAFPIDPIEAKKRAVADGGRT